MFVAVVACPKNGSAIAFASSPDEFTNAALVKGPAPLPKECLHMFDPAIEKELPETITREDFLLTKQAVARRAVQEAVLPRERWPDPRLIGDIAIQLDGTARRCIADLERIAKYAMLSALAILRHFVRSLAAAP